MENNSFGKIVDFLRLHHEVEDHDSVREVIVKGVDFRGTNTWILIFAIVVASVGLNMNSTAVIIGAMLISPLMGPITGVGFSIATYDFPLFRKSLKNVGYSVATALVASFLYFLLTPIKLVFHAHFTIWKTLFKPLVNFLLIQLWQGAVRFKNN